ncbi:YrhA family protein [Butyrivibrio fibrisolvens]|uniref:Knr4/Smi1-like domain-containing protein n=1 Tax=Butyrivibrio fibrisolvens TaxID=831 RepID=A0A317G3X5_BUTFI|nr:YrhA family protein [Butyrivibrio fibrisolvens]PWT28745.1 hypothetical protein CPT75_17340 [Butyrivibrio fibrisolvens]
MDNKMWEKEIEKIKKEFVGWGYKVNEPASDDEISRFTTKVKDKFQIEIPSEYIDFLKEINGYSFNGLLVYGIDMDLLDNAPNNCKAGFIEYNDDRSVSDEEKWIYFAESEFRLYVFRVQDATYYKIEDFSYDIQKKYDSFAEMIMEAINDSLK